MHIQHIVLTPNGYVLKPNHNKCNVIIYADYRFCPGLANLMKRSMKYQ